MFVLIHSLHVGWRNIFPVVLLCQFLVVAAIVLGDIYEKICPSGGIIKYAQAKGVSAGDSE
jgi:hypothetical protein